MKNKDLIMKNKDFGFALISSIIVVLAIFILVFEPFNDIPFIYNQF